MIMKIKQAWWIVQAFLDGGDLSQQHEPAPAKPKTNGRVDMLIKLEMQTLQKLKDRAEFGSELYFDVDHAMLCKKLGD